MPTTLQYRTLIFYCFHGAALFQGPVPAPARPWCSAVDPTDRYIIGALLRWGVCGLFVFIDGNSESETTLKSLQPDHLVHSLCASAFMIY